MTQDERRKYIIDLLKVEGQVRVSQLSRELNTSEVTIRNDLAELEKDALLERVHGGAVQTLKNYYALGYSERLEQRKLEKIQMAKLTTELVRDGDSLIINSGSTTYYFIQELKLKKKNLKIITNSLQIAKDLAGVAGFRTVLLGGMVSDQYQFTYGDDAILQLNRYQVDKTVLSLDGVHLENGLTTYHHEVAELCRLMLQKAVTRIALADHTKIGHTAFTRIAKPSEIDILVSDRKAGAKFLKGLQKQEVRIIAPGLDLSEQPAAERPAVHQ